MTDKDQKIVWNGEFLPYGESYSITGSVTNNLRFPGQYYDSETGKHDNGFRIYNPDTGTFPQRDPIGFAGGINLYSYTNNPINVSDPLGLSPIIDPNKPGEKIPRGLKDNARAIEAFKKTLREVERKTKIIEWLEKKILTSGVAKLSGLLTPFGILLHPDVLNENEDEMIREYYRKLYNSRCK